MSYLRLHCSRHRENPEVMNFVPYMWPISDFYYFTKHLRRIGELSMVYATCTLYQTLLLNIGQSEPYACCTLHLSYLRHLSLHRIFKENQGAKRGVCYISPISDFLTYTRYLGKCGKLLMVYTTYTLSQTPPLQNIVRSRKL